MRQLVVNEAPDKDGLISISSKDYRYLKQVLRVQVGDMINVRLPEGSLQAFTVAKINEKNLYNNVLI